MAEVSEPPMSVPPPSRLGRYALVRKLGTGGMGEVWLARDVEAGGRPVAIKRILSHLAFDPRAAQMFLDEARIASQLDHPNVVKVLDVGCVEGWHYLAMEYVLGENLARIIDRAKRRRLPVPTVLAARIVAEAAKGAHHAHTRKDATGRPLEIIHRDMTPPNIMVTDEGDVMVLDFGIAKAVDRVARTQAGSVKGKVEYLSPEQILGEKIDARADIFSLGAVLFELATQRKLFARESMVATLNAVTECRVPLPSKIAPHVDPRIDEIVLRATRRDRNERFQSALEMREALLEFMRGRETRAGSRELAAFVGDLFREEQADRRRILALETAETTQPGIVRPDDPELDHQTAPGPKRRTFAEASEEPTLIAPVGSTRPQLSPVPAPKVATPSPSPMRSRAPLRATPPPPSPIPMATVSDPSISPVETTQPSAPRSAGSDDLTPPPRFPPAAPPALELPSLAPEPSLGRHGDAFEVTPTPPRPRTRRSRARRKSRVFVAGGLLSLSVAGAIVGAALLLEESARAPSPTIPALEQARTSTTPARLAATLPPPMPVEDPPAPSTNIARTDTATALPRPASASTATAAKTRNAQLASPASPAPASAKSIGAPRGVGPAKSAAAPRSPASSEAPGEPKATPRRAVGSVMVAVTSRGRALRAGVFLDDEWVGLSPVEVRAETGAHLLRIEQEGYTPLRRGLDIPAGRASAMSFELKPLPSGAAPEPPSSEGVGEDDEVEVEIH
ncbi:MAG: serine/threonine protein kinase [Deltaproteobacteria bacterium]|nr:serine/threonine protein kinase [Deltaproteobacteria bacterium]